MGEKEFATSRRTFLKAGTGAVAATTVPSVTLTYSAKGANQSKVVIKRDRYGVPHIYATGGQERPAAFFGHGYAVATDRLFQLEMYRRFYHGTVAAVLGAGPDGRWVQFDRAARRNRSTDVPLAEQIETHLDDEHQAVLEAFADGINRYISNVEDGKRAFHKGFHEHDFTPDRWDREDVAGVFVASMSYFSQYQLETLGADILNQLEDMYNKEMAVALFDDLNWGDDPSAPTSTEPATTGYTPSYRPAGDTAPSESVDQSDVSDDSANKHRQRQHQTNTEYRIPTDPQSVHETAVERRRTLARGLDDLGLPFKLGSNALAVSGEQTDSGDALLYGGPQMGFTTPSVMYEVGLHGSDFDITGSTVAGYPFVMFGHTNHGALTSTAGLDNSLQMFVETICQCEDGPDQYRFHDNWYDVTSTTETIPVADGPDEAVTIRRTRHGVVTQWRPEHGEAITMGRSYEGLDMNSWKAFYDAQFATDAEEFVAASQQCDYSLNFMWAGDDGDIAYAHLGRYPDWQSVPWDTRLPADGTQHELTDDDYLRAQDDETPWAINPSPGYTAQWNNKPSPDWNNGDMSYAWGADHRVQRIINLVEHRLSTAGSLDYDFLKEVIYDIAFVDLRAIRYKQPLIDALADTDLTDTEQAAFEAVQSWDNFRQASGENHLGQYPVGYTVFNRFFPKLLQETFEPTFGSLYQRALVFLNYRYGRPTLLRALHPDEAALEPAVDYFDGDQATVFQTAFKVAVAELKEEFGEDVSEWRAPAETESLDNLSLFGVPIGVGDAGDMPLLNRGTENHLVQVQDRPGEHADFRAENILPPGESGYIAPDGTKDEHYADQLQEFINFTYKQLRFTRAAVAREHESTETIHRTD